MDIHEQLTFRQNFNVAECFSRLLLDSLKRNNSHACFDLHDITIKI